MPQRDNEEVDIYNDDGDNDNDQDDRDDGDDEEMLDNMTKVNNDWPYLLMKPTSPIAHKMKTIGIE